MIHTENLSKQFGEVNAVESLSLEIPQGEVFGFLGPNGAGKTTTVRLLASLIKPSSGTAWVNGFKVGKQDKFIRGSVGLLTETPGMYDTLSAERNLQIYASLYEVTDVAGQIEKYLRMLGLWDQRKDPAGTFSKGMKQKLAIARSLLHEPATLFLDEPTAGLDPEAARLVRDFILETKKQGRTIFLCTHNLDEADRLCDRIAVFRTRMLITDTPTNLRARMFGRKVVFQLKSAEQSIISLFSGLPYVKDVQVTNNQILIHVDEPEEHNPELIRLLVGAGADIQFVGEIRHSLEDVYFELIENSI